MRLFLPVLTKPCFLLWIIVIYHVNNYCRCCSQIMTRTKLFHHITPILAFLHWLPLYYWIVLLTCKAFNGLASEILRPDEKGSCLKSSFKELLAVPRTRYKTKEVTYGHISSATHTHARTHAHRHTHSSEHTHPEQWAANYAAAPREQLGVHSWYWRWRECCTFTPPPTIPADPRLKLVTFQLWVPTLWPLGHDFTYIYIDRDRAVRFSKFWNSLPHRLSEHLNVCLFNCWLKTYLYRCDFSVLRSLFVFWTWSFLFPRRLCCV